MNVWVFEEEPGESLRKHERDARSELTRPPRRVHLGDENQPRVQDFPSTGGKQEFPAHAASSPKARDIDTMLDGNPCVQVSRWSEG